MDGPWPWLVLILDIDFDENAVAGSIGENLER
jgi:hypothetical protein